MTDIQWRRLDDIESWRQKAFVLSRTDRLGRLISKTFDLIQSVVRDGPNAKTLILEVELLREEQLNAMNTDPNQDDIFRSLFYGLSSSFGSMIESIKERNKEKECTIQVNALDQVDVNNNNGNQMDDGEKSNRDEQYPLIDQCFFPEASAKIELLESFQDLSEADVKPLNLFDVDSEEPQEDNGMDNILSESMEIDHINATAEFAQSIRKRRRVSVITTNNTGEEVVTTPKAAGSGNCATGRVTARKSSNGKCAAGKFNCNKCERAFGTPSGLKLHHTIFHKGFQCGECDIRKRNLENLLKHYAEYHPGKSPKDTESNAYSSLKCSLCYYAAQSYSKLKLHMRTHTGEKPFTCSDCPAKFAHKSNLTEHIRRLHAMKK